MRRFALILLAVATLAPLPVQCQPDPVDEDLGRFDREQKEPPLPALPLDTSLDDQPLIDVSGPLTLEQCLALAKRRNPTLLTAQAEVRRLWHAYKYAGSVPSTIASLNRTQGSGPASANTYSGYAPDTYLQIQQTFWPLGSFTTGRKVALHAFYEAQQNLKNAEVTLTQNVKDNFFTVLDGQEKLRLAKDNVDFAEHIYDIAVKQYNAGAGPRLNLLTAEVQVNLARQTYLLADATLKQNLAQLAPILGLAGHAALQLKGELKEPSRDYVYKSLLALAREHPQIEAAREALANAEQTVRFDAQQANPTPSLFTIVDLAGHGPLNITLPTSYVVGAGISVPISWGQVGYTTRQARDLVREGELSVQNATQSVSSNLKSNYELYLANSKNADLFAKEILAPQEEAARITELGFRKGALSYAALLQVEQNLVQVRGQYVDVLLSVHTSFDALEAAVGRSLPEPNAPSGLGVTPTTPKP